VVIAGVAVLVYGYQLFSIIVALNPFALVEIYAHPVTAGGSGFGVIVTGDPDCGITTIVDAVARVEAALT
jgi:hypothetical protein